MGRTVLANLRRSRKIPFELALGASIWQPSDGAEWRSEGIKSARASS
jgi:hypothetical protein